MCRMALIVSKDKSLSGFEVAFKTAWASHNDDGVGIYWKDSTKHERHLARFPLSRDLAKVGQEYERMLIHFRKSTKGTGTHPFVCRDKPALDSENWLMTHNGAVQDEEARKLLIAAGHKFATQIDSEVMTHAWGESEGKTLDEKVKSFVKQCAKYKISGWANLLFYNVKTDEWAAFCDGSLVISQTKDKSILVVSSDTAWMDTTEADRLKITRDDMASGEVAWGKGLTFKTKKNVWSRPSYSTTESCYVGGNNRMGAYGGDYRNGRALYSAAEIDENKRKTDNQTDAMRKFWGTGPPNNELTDPKSHYFKPMDEWPDICDTCYYAKEHHDLDHEDKAEDESAADEVEKILKGKKGGITEGQWNTRHPFTRDEKAKDIRCKCGITYGFGMIHMAHEFLPLGKNVNNVYCSVCGSTRIDGNHKETEAMTHFFAALYVSSGKSFVRSPLCGRCGHQEKEHPATYTQAKQNTEQQQVLDANPVRDELVRVKREDDGEVWQYIKPLHCSCRTNVGPKEKPTVCEYHFYDRGFKSFVRENDGTVLLCKIATQIDKKSFNID